MGPLHPCEAQGTLKKTEQKELKSQKERSTNGRTWRCCCTLDPIPARDLPMLGLPVSCHEARKAESPPGLRQIMVASGGDTSSHPSLSIKAVMVARGGTDIFLNDPVLPKKKKNMSL